ncbi:ATP-dependent protease subunit HslV [Candidatus Aerophobetes bacterium]|uniref:ATP-dependent protease subunit HslV n=1 Tax=Aerophobetes bacterium TaxID=2030807 RepID=A0A662DAC1_UNCAE|nr:ATP-dependent protease subunit HslV [Candidatus Aerophobetes bacterium]RLE12734.1 MAG: HslU--HslV peptidase proteolytic subunit [Candidatus Aerophobetes bacterium]HDN84823.1 ATP-dependent protease subunit HslV [Candidatus Aerophobetes bacterium]
MFKGTTILAVRRDKKVALGGDGQVTFQNTIMKQRASKVRRLYKGRILAGFAGGVADALTLFEKFEKKIDQYQGNLSRASLELAKEWRQDKVLRKLEALMIVADREKTLVISGSGDVIEPDDDVIAIGSGAGYAQAAAKALWEHTSYDPAKIVDISIRIAASICIYTNNQITIENLE